MWPGIIMTSLVLVLYAAAVATVPWLGWLSPRGGIVTLGISLLLANGALWFARQPQHSARRRFELTFAAWLWMGVQAGCLLWFVLAE